MVRLLMEAEMTAKGPRMPRICPSCGTSYLVTNGQIARGRGNVCSRACNARHNLTKHGHTANGMTSPTYSTWATMVARCTNPNATKYPEYGGRGIGVSEDWRDFRNFVRDMGERPKGTTLDRIDGTKGYFNGNCRWATPRQQSDNIRTVTMVSYEGKQATLAQLSRQLGINKDTLANRIKRGWPESQWGRQPH